MTPDIDPEGIWLRFVTTATSAELREMADLAEAYPGASEQMLALVAHLRQSADRMEASAEEVQT